MIGASMFFKAVLLSAALEAGVFSGGVLNYHDRSVPLYCFDALYTTLSTRAEIGPLYVGGAIECYFTPAQGLNFSVFQNTYIFQAGLNLGNVSLNYEHSCFHPNQPYATITGSKITPRYEGAYDRIFVRIATK